MATARTITKTWVARDAIVQIANSDDVTIDDSATLSGSFTDAAALDITAPCKNVTITPPETSWEKQDLLGQDTNDFQNQLLDEKPVGLATFTGTLVLGEDETIEDIIVSGTVAAKPAGYTRYQIGNANDLQVSVSVTVEDPTTSDTVSFVLDNGRVTKYGDVRISGPDSHWEQDITVICLAKDFYYEFRDA